MPKLIYVVEDDENIREVINLCLLSENYHVEVFENACLMLENITKPDLILMDVMMPKMSGFEALKILKADPKLNRIPVILISAKTSELDKVEGLELGADDYLTKPFGLLELRARVKANLRRTTSEDIINFKDIVIDKERHAVIKNGEILDLTAKEYDLLCFLVENKNKVIEREKIIMKVWGYDFIGESRTIDMHIKSLRSKLNCDSKNPSYIKTIRSLGYMAFDKE